MMKQLRRNYYLPLALPLLFLLPALGGFIFNQGADFNDIAISHYPNALWIQRSITEWGEVPLWSNTILSGYPFAANPLSGLHYPPGWLGLLLPLPFGLNLVAVLHLILGGVGMVRFVYSQTSQEWSALFGGLAYAGMPKLLAHLGAGHLTLIYAAGWLPWLLLAQHAAWEQPRKRFFVPGLILGLILLADVRMFVIAGALWGVFSIEGLLRIHHRSNWRKIITAILRLVATPFIAVCLGAVLLLPLAEYTQVSTRSLMQVTDIGALSLPAARLFGLLIPEMGGTAEWVIYSGSMVFGLGLLALFLKRDDRKVYFWWGVFILSLLWALGDQLPWFRFLAQIPGLNLVRVPPRMMIVGLFSLIMASSLSISTLLTDPESLKRLPKINALLILVGLAFLVILLTPVVWASTGEIPLRFLWGAVSMVGMLVILFLARSQRIYREVLPWLMCGWLLIDITGVNVISMDYRPKDDTLNEGKQTAEALITTMAFDYFRTYSPSYSIPQQTAAYYRIELADGVDPLQLTAYTDFMQQASGIASNGYSVTLPPYLTGVPATDNQDAVPDARLLGLLNVGYVAAQYPLHANGLVSAGQFGSTHIYKNSYALPRAWIQDADAAPGESIRSTPLLIKTANHLELAVDGPGLLVVSEIAYPGWDASIDGLDQPILTVGGLLRGLVLPAGEHTVVLDYRPVLFILGAGISIVTLLVIGLIWFILGRRTNENPE